MQDADEYLEDMDIRASHVHVTAWLVWLRSLGKRGCMRGRVVVAVKAPWG